MRLSRKAHSPMNPVSDNLLTSLTGPLPKGGAATGPGVWGDPAGLGAEEAPPPGGFAAVLERVQDAGVAPPAAAGDAASALNSDTELQDALALTESLDRQEMATGLVAQWAALLGSRDLVRPPQAQGATSDTTTSPPAASDGAGEADLGVLVGPVPAAGLPTFIAPVVPDVPIAPGSPIVSDSKPATDEGMAAAGRQRPAASPSTAPEGPSGQPVAQAKHGDATASSTEPSRDGALDASSGAPMLPLPALVTWQLSPQLAVITAGQPTASDDSLRAYAAAQGFDAAALQRMFGADKAVGSSPESPEGEASAIGIGATSGPLWRGAPDRWASAMTTAAATTATGPGTTPATVAGMAPTGQVPAAASPTGLAGLRPTASGPAASEGTAPSPQGRPSAGAASATMPTTGSKVPSTVDFMPPSGAKSPESLAAALGAFQAFRADGGRLNGPRTAQGVAPPTQSAWWALQARSGLGLNPAASLDSSLTGGGPVAAATALPATLDNPSGAALDAAASPSSAWMGITDSAPVGQKAEPTTRPVDPQVIDLREHLEHGHEVLSKRLGEALAARMMAQIDKGEWQIRLSVAPQHLGPIDIDLQMRGHRIDAQFQVAHGQTQAMIQDGLPRLRDAVGASGMDLASVWVSGGWNERNRGNPTPGQPDNPAPLALKEDGGDEQTVSGTPAVDSDRPGRGSRPGAVDILI